MDGGREPHRYLDTALLTAGTGLAVEQIHAGIAGHNTRAREIQERGVPPNLGEPHLNCSLGRFLLNPGQPARSGGSLLVT